MIVNPPLPFGQRIVLSSKTQTGASNAGNCRDRRYRFPRITQMLVFSNNLGKLHSLETPQP